jgi:hypothetical protein
MESHPAHVQCFCHRTRYKCSTPIEIPARRRPTTTVHSPARSAAASPELIFEMSPLDSTLHSTYHDRSFCPFPKDDDPSFFEPSEPHCFASKPQYAIREPFLYSFPMLASHHFHSRSVQPELANVPTDASCTAAIADPQRRVSHRLSANGLIRHDRGRSPSSKSTHTIRKVTAHKVVGFQPENLSPCCIPRRPTRPLLPSTPFRSPGTLSIGEGLDISYSSSESNISSFEFENFLVRRIDDEKTIQFTHRQPISSMHISFGS